MAAGVVDRKAVGRPLPNPTVRATVTVSLGATATLGTKWLDALLDPSKVFEMTPAAAIATME